MLNTLFHWQVYLGYRSSTLSEAGSSVYKITEGEKDEIEGKEVIAPNAPNTCRLSSL